MHEDIEVDTLQQEHWIDKLHEYQGLDEHLQNKRISVIDLRTSINQKLDTRRPKQKINCNSGGLLVFDLIVINALMSNLEMKLMATVQKIPDLHFHKKYYLQRNTLVSTR